MIYYKGGSASESEESDYFSADEAGSDIDIREDEHMDWETSVSLVSIPYAPKDTVNLCKPLLCANAAAFMILMQNPGAMKQLLNADTLQRVLLVDTDCKETEPCAILAMPLVSSKFTYEANVLSNDVEDIDSKIQTLHDISAFAMISSDIHCITVSTVAMGGAKNGPTVLIFIPPLGSATSESDEAAFHLFPSKAEASTYINQLFQPLQEVTVYTMLPKPVSGNPLESVLPIYEANLRLLERSMKLNDIKSDAQRCRHITANLERSLAAEEKKTEDANNAVTILQWEIEDVQQELSRQHESNDAMLSEQSNATWQEWKYSDSTASSSATESLSKPKTWGISWRDVPTPMQFLGASSSKGDSTSHSLSTQVKGQRESPKPQSRPRSRSGSYHSPFDDSSGSSGQDDINASFQEALRIQAQCEMERDASYQLARQLEEEERAQLATFEELRRAEKHNGPFDCSICAETYPGGNKVKIESCGQECVTCRGCLLNHIKSQVEQAKWPIFCPICPNTAPRRGVVSRWMAEIVGADDAVFAQWNRMELANFSISVECPKCKVSTPIDAGDFKAARVLDCPARCGAHWCKNCHRQIARGGTHSCDGEAEFRELLETQKNTFKPCPNCGSMIEKNGGCDNMVCTAPGCGTRFTWRSAKAQTGRWYG